MTTQADKINDRGRLRTKLVAWDAADQKCLR
jgi:hypothetical protein